LLARELLRMSATTSEVVSLISTDRNRLHEAEI